MIKVSRTNFYGHDPEGYVILVILNIIAFFLLNYYYSVLGFEVTDVASFFAFILKGGLPVYTCLLFFICGIFVIYNTITNIKEYDDILIFSDVEDKKKRTGVYNFYDAAGKKYACLIYGNHNFVHKRYYKVRRTKYEIKYILGSSRKKFSVPKKVNRAFWLTWYLPGGACIENLFLLPIVYVIALAGISMFINGDINSIKFLPSYILIGIDLWYKYNNR